MPASISLLLLAIVIVGVIVAIRALKTVWPLVVNAAVGLVVLVLANLVGFGVTLTPLAVLIVAFGGLPGAVLIVLLAHAHVAFQPMALLPA